MTATILPFRGREWRDRWVTNEEMCELLRTAIDACESGRTPPEFYVMYGCDDPKGMHHIRERVLVPPASEEVVL